MQEDTVKELIRIYDKTPRKYIEDNLKIKSKEGLIIRFKFNKVQRMIDNHSEVRRRVRILNSIYKDTPNKTIATIT
jgi:pyruvate-formate lyase-activating enzyme